MYGNSVASELHEAIGCCTRKVCQIGCNSFSQQLERTFAYIGSNNSNLPALCVAQ